MSNTSSYIYTTNAWITSKNCSDIITCFKSGIRNKQLLAIFQQFCEGNLQSWYSSKIYDVDAHNLLSPKIIWQVRSAPPPRPWVWHLCFTHCFWELGCITFDCSQLCHYNMSQVQSNKMHISTHDLIYYYSTKAAFDGTICLVTTSEMTSCFDLMWLPLAGRSQGQQFRL